MSLENITFEGKHIDEKILHFTKPSKIQTIYENIRILIPVLLIQTLSIFLYNYGILNIIYFIIFWIILDFATFLTIYYKIYRVNKNFLIITSKRILFHGMEGLFKDYVKKISYDNVRNVNYFTTSILGKIYNYGTLEIQSSHGGLGDITVYNINNGKMLTHYIDKIMHLTPDERTNFGEFDPNYFKKD
ncbi:MAG: hypothetical protein NWP80_01305 [Candidatus Gracilibacteria bacterium]|nr:hypothetical protein [Candidatus Gracilibacteria bacterium]